MQLERFIRDNLGTRIPTFSSNYIIVADIPIINNWIKSNIPIIDEKEVIKLVKSGELNNKKVSDLVRIYRGMMIKKGVKS